MSDSKHNRSTEERLAALEAEVCGIRGDIEGIRQWLKSEHDHFIKLNGSQDRVVDNALDRLDFIEDLLEPAFSKLFPDFGKCIVEIEAIIDPPRKR